MVSITNSNPFLGTKKPEESSNESDNSGLENIFASMLAVIEDENDGLREDSQEGTVTGVANLLEKIKLEIGVFENEELVKNVNSNGKLLSSSNILNIYQAYKAQIDEAIEVANDAIVSFDMELLLESELALKKSVTGNGQKDLPIDELNLRKEQIRNPAFEYIAEDDSIEKFSELEMTRIKSAMKGSDGNNFQLEHLDTKKVINETGKSKIHAHTLSKQFGSNINSVKENPLSNMEQSSLESKQTIQIPDGSKLDTSIEQTFSSSRALGSKINSSGLQTQNSQNNDLTHLKLLEKNWGKDLAKIIEKAIISGKDKIDISLEPQRLGKIQLTLTMLNNQTSIFISTENSAASLILTNSEERLAQMFESAGYKLSNFQANSNGSGSSNQKKDGSKGNEQNKNHVMQIDKSDSNEYEDKGLLTIDGRKIINLIA